jgi:hypothetical protein
MKKLTITVAMLVWAVAFAQQKAENKPAAAGGAAAQPAAPAKAAPAPAKAEVAPAQPPPAAPKPPAEVEAMAKFMGGTWKCNGTAFANAMNPTEHKYTSKMQAKLDLDKYWITSRYEEKKTKEHTMAFKMQGYMTYDASQKKWVSMGVDNMGGWMMSTSAGMVGDKMESMGEATVPGMGKMGLKETVTKKSEKEINWAIEFQMGGKGPWVKGAEAICKK